jgi:hypothetical protein
MRQFELSMPTIFAERMKILTEKFQIDSGLQSLIGMACAESLVHAHLLWKAKDYQQLKEQIQAAYDSLPSEDDEDDWKCPSCFSKDCRYIHLPDKRTGDMHPAVICGECDLVQFV